MKQVTTLKMNWQTTHFNTGQVVYILKSSKNKGFLCRGKFKDKGHFVSAWVRINGDKFALVRLQEVEITQKEYAQIWADVKIDKP